MRTTNMINHTANDLKIQLDEAEMILKEMLTNANSTFPERSKLRTDILKIQQKLIVLNATKVTFKVDMPGAADRLDSLIRVC